MNLILAISFLGIFLIAPSILIKLKISRWEKMPWLAILLMIAVIGWLSINAAIYFRFEYLNKLAIEFPNNLILAEKAQTDGGTRVFGFLFGWLYALIYSLPWLIFYKIRWRQKDMPE